MRRTWFPIVGATVVLWRCSAVGVSSGLSDVARRRGASVVGTLSTLLTQLLQKLGVSVTAVNKAVTVLLEHAQVDGVQRRNHGAGFARAGWTLH